jgi:hypothetical protein
MEYFARNDASHLREAVRYYSEYIAREPNGKRAGEATEQLSKLKPLLDTKGGAAPEPQPGAMAMAPSKPRVMISSPTEGVKVKFDGKPVAHPYIAEVAPGKHKVMLSAPGHKDYTRDLTVDAKTGAPPLDIPLEPLPAELVIHAPDGADVAIDGRLQGVTPLPPLPISAGRHFVAVTMNGRHPYSSRVTLKRGERRTIETDLTSTGQRTASWVLMGVGAGGIVAGGVLGFVAFHKQSQAQDILDASKDKGDLDSSELGRYESLRKSRDNFRLAAAVSATAGAGVGALGLMLNLFDQPKAPLPPAEEGVPGEPKRGPESGPSMEISAAPLVAPGIFGGGIHGRF